jgi:hypothetical protein
LFITEKKTPNEAKKQSKKELCCTHMLANVLEDLLVLPAGQDRLVHLEHLVPLAHKDHLVLLVLPARKDQRVWLVPRARRAIKGRLVPQVTLVNKGRLVHRVPFKLILHHHKAQLWLLLSQVDLRERVLWWACLSPLLELPSPEEPRLWAISPVFTHQLRAH